MSLAEEDHYRKTANQSDGTGTGNNKKRTMDIWSNPIHHQVHSVSRINSSSAMGGFEGDANAVTGSSVHNTDNTHNTHINDIDVYNDDVSSESENHGYQYTVPIKQKKGDSKKFQNNLLNNVAAEDAVMDDIIGHMNTPMGDDDDDDDSNDDTPTSQIQMSDIYGKQNKASEGIETNEFEINGDDQVDQVFTPNGGDNINDDLDEINNNIVIDNLIGDDNNNNNNNNNDDDVVGDIDENIGNIDTPNGVTIGGPNQYDDDLDIDNIDNDDSENIVNQVDNFLMTHGGNDQNIIDEIDDINNNIISYDNDNDNDNDNDSQIVNDVDKMINNEMAITIGMDQEGDTDDDDDDIIDQDLAHEMQTPGGGGGGGHIDNNDNYNNNNNNNNNNEQYDDDDLDVNIDDLLIEQDEDSHYHQTKGYLQWMF